ncbi:hypothetical protein UACE39S_02824 [Ureibacillus acetophenoni]
MKIRVSAVQYHLHTIESFDDFAQQCEHYIRVFLNLKLNLFYSLSFSRHNYCLLKEQMGKL